MIEIAIVAAIAMIIQDILGTLLVQANARDRAVLSGFLDSLGWFAGIITTTLSVTAIQGHDWPAKITMCAFVTAANFGGSYIGVKVGERFLKVKPRREGKHRRFIKIGK